MSPSPHGLTHPIVQAPMGGGPSTPALAAAVSAAGGLGFLAAGYLPVDRVGSDLEDARRLTEAPVGVNLFLPPGPAGDTALVEHYADGLAGEAQRYGVALGEPRHDDDAFEEKLALVLAEEVPIVSFTFGCPPGGVIDRVHEAGAAVWATVTTPDEAVAAAAAGADVLVVQGVEAGGHRGSFDDGAAGDIGLLALLQLVGAAVELPLVASGGIATGRAIAAVLAAGAAAAQLGTAFMLTPEAATLPAQRAVLAAGAERTAITRAFTGRAARGVVNRFMTEHEAGAPSAYPEVHHLTSPVRAEARERGDAGGFNLWAGQAYPLATPEPAGELVRRLSAEARDALREAAERLQ